MKLDSVKLAYATAIIFGGIWIICSILVVLIPGAMMQMSGHMLHADLGTMAWTLNWAGFIIGLILWTLLPAVIVWAIAATYNRLLA